ncbi:MAG TPA: molybdopterin molybdotransferase MoeA [Hyphomicrobiaceae bacterium]|nr:molybdopterin molybdotransferase MoeA [Hyphomicrobiaceae bacterium]
MPVKTDRSLGRERASVANVLAWIDRHVIPLPAEHVAVAQAAGRLLAEEVRAEIDVPPVDRAAADGFALRADETVGASGYNPLPFQLVSAPGGLPPGSARAIQSGEPLPSGADAIVRIEHGEAAKSGVLNVIDPVAAGNEVERAASQLTRGSLIASAGQQLGAPHIGLLAAAGRTRVSVVRRPHVRCLLAGSNLVTAGGTLPSGSTYDADGPLLRALIERDGGLLSEEPTVKRGCADIARALAEPGADIVLVVGATGLGTEDHAAAALAEAGSIAVHGVALRPADTAGCGQSAAGTPVFLLPGAPVACLWAYELLAGRAVRRLGARNPELPFARRQRRLAGKIVSEIGMTEVRAVRCLPDGGVEPLASFAEAGLAAAAHADGFVIVPEDSEGFGQGARITVYLYYDRALAMDAATL